jgi:hypothetical protein
MQASAGGEEDDDELARRARSRCGDRSWLGSPPLHSGLPTPRVALENEEDTIKPDDGIRDIRPTDGWHRAVFYKFHKHQ